MKDSMKDSMKVPSLLFISLFISLFAAKPALAGCASCGPYNSEKKAVAEYCRSHPASTSVGSGRDGTTPAGQVHEAPLTCAERTAKFDAQYGQLREFCEAYDVMSKGKSAEMSTAAFFTIAAGVCAYACFGDPISKGAWEVACTATSGVSGLMDIIEGIKLKSMMTSLVGAGFFGGAIASRVVGGMGESAVSVGGKEFSTSCVTFGATTLIAGLKWLGAKNSGGNAADACNNAAKLNSKSTASETGGYSNSLVTSTASGGRNAGSGLETAQNKEDFGADAFMNEAQSAATGELGSFVSNLPNLNQMPSALDKLGISTNDIHGALENQGPGSILSGVPGLPSDVKTGLGKLDEELAKGLMSGKYDVPGAIAKSGGGAGGSKKDGFKMDFGSLFGKKEDGPGLAKELKFNAQGALSDSDIWHAGWKGSIFQIVSTRLGKSRDKIDQLEWQSPLNRALTGLPSKPAEKKK